MSLFLPTSLGGFYYSTGYSPFYGYPSTLPFTYYPQAALSFSNYYPASATATTSAAPALALAPAASFINYPSYAFQPAVYYPYSSGCRNGYGAPVPCALPYDGFASAPVVEAPAVVAETPAAIAEAPAVVAEAPVAIAEAPAPAEAAAATVAPAAVTEAATAR